jgi:hypothetical protein
MSRSLAIFDIYILQRLSINGTTVWSRGKLVSQVLPSQDDFGDFGDFEDFVVGSVGKSQET